MTDDGEGVNRICVLLALGLLLAHGVASAQSKEYPQRPIRIVVPVVPGGSVDVVARLLSPKLAESLGQSVVVDKYSSAGGGTLTHLGAELFKYHAQINLAHVPYKGGAPALVAVVAGECEVSFQTPLAAAGQVTAGRLRAIAVTGTKRLSMFPDVPTVAESGLPRYEFQSWVGLLAPAATPPAIIKTLNEHIVRAARAPDVAERFTRDAQEVIASSPEDFRRQMATETRLWAGVIREMGIKAD